jgi:hypothetical protein
MRSVCRVAVRRMTDVDTADVQMGKASDDRDQAENQTDTETNEIEGVHIIWCSVSQLF